MTTSALGRRTSANSQMSLIFIFEVKLLERFVVTPKQFDQEA